MDQAPPNEHEEGHSIEVVAPAPQHPYANALANLPKAKRTGRGRGLPPKHITALAPVAPLDGQPPRPPDDVPPTSILSAHAGPWGHLTTPTPSGAPVEWEPFEDYVDSGPNVRRLDQQIGVLARHIMLAALWKSEGWAPKEKFDAAIAAVKAVEGAKGELWVQQGPRKDYTMEEYDKERKASEDRLRKLLAAQRRGEGVTPTQVVEAATRVIDVEAKENE